MYFNSKVFINIKRHVLYFTVESAIAKKQIFDEYEFEESATLLKCYAYDDDEAGPEIVEGMNAADNQHLRFFRVYIYFILLKNNSSMQTEYINETSKKRLRFVFLIFYIKFTSLMKKIDCLYIAFKLHLQKYFQDKNIKAI